MTDSTGDAVREVPSREFRKTYPRLVDPTAVTVLGRVIGYWYPAGTEPRLLAETRFVATPTEIVTGTVPAPSADRFADDARRQRVADAQRAYHRTLGKGQPK